ncbi:MAG: glycoside hydrolase family 99-like domain-containing protein [Terriglobia bacterium]
MRRRRFFQTLAGSSALLPMISEAAIAQAGGDHAAAENSSNIPAVIPGDLEAYFTEEKLRQAIDTTAPLDGIKFEVVAYNFPSWHPSPYMEKIFGKGWTEFETLKNSRPLYPGHLFPKYPLWGYFNEAEPEWAEREIETAAEFGIDAWMIDWYWHSGTMFYHEQLENGFLKARNRSKLKFALMWANHHWKNVYPARSPREAATILPQLHSEADALAAIDYCIEHYFHEPNYWRIGGLPVFAIFDVNLMLETFTPAQLKATLDKMRERAARAGLGGLHFQASHVYGGHEGELKALGFDSATMYHTFGWTYGEKPPGGRTPYGTAALGSIEAWRRTAAKVNVPFFPDCPVGWDDSPRFGPSAHMVTERTPDQYERLLRAAKYFCAESSAKPKIIFLSAWNEWTEDHVLLPDSVFGYSYLEAVRRAFRG